MNREILFRGFNEDPNGNEEIELDGKIIKGMWLYGGYHKHRKINYCFKEEEPEDNIEHYIFIDRQADWNMENGIQLGKVIPQTVGQGTILKNKLRLFEGDMYHHGDPNITYTVVWQDNSLKGKQKGSSSYAGLKYWEDRIQKIGTIFDKKEVSDE